MKPVLAAAVFLAGCATGQRPVALPDGRQGYEANCSGTARSYSDCMNYAARVCHGPYQILDRNQYTAGAMATPVGNTVLVSQGEHRTMLFACGSPPK